MITQLTYRIYRNSLFASYCTFKKEVFRLRAVKNGGIKKNVLLHDIDLFDVPEGKYFFGPRANDLAVVLCRHLDQRRLAVDEPVWQHHGVVVLVLKSDFKLSSIRYNKKGHSNNNIVTLF